MYPGETLGFTRDENGKLVPPPKHVLKRRREEQKLAKRRIFNTFKEDRLGPLLKDNPDAAIAVGVALGLFANIFSQRYDQTLLLFPELCTDKPDAESFKRIGRAEGMASALLEQVDEILQITEIIPEELRDQIKTILTAHFNEDV